MLRSALPATRDGALDLDDIVHAYGPRVAVDRVSLAVASGEILCLVGPSGCGKSTLLRVAAGLETLQHGTVRIGGVVVATPRRSSPPERRGIGLVFQDYALFPHLRVRDNVRFGIRGGLAADAERRAAETLAMVGMADYADAYPHTLSGGQQQRVALARALAPGPRALLLDEPFSGLDVRLRQQVRDETLHLLKRRGVATMMVTHDPEEAMFMADRIALMRDGRIVQAGTPSDLYCRPTDAFAATFFGDANRLAGTTLGGQVRTPVGTVAAPGRPDGQPVEILIRPEALVLRQAGAGGDPPPGVTATVEAARLLGRTSLIHLSVPGPQGATHLHARMPGQYLPADGSMVAIDLDPMQAFVFGA
jgi:iron(III) transport system ATP-binding protein